MVYIKLQLLFKEPSICCFIEQSQKLQACSQPSCQSLNCSHRKHNWTQQTLVNTIPSSAAFSIVNPDNAFLLFCYLPIWHCSHLLQLHSKINFSAIICPVNITKQTISPVFRTSQEWRPFVDFSSHPSTYSHTQQQEAENLFKSYLILVRLRKLIHLGIIQTNLIFNQKYF